MSNATSIISVNTRKAHKMDAIKRNRIENGVASLNYFWGDRDIPSTPKYEDKNESAITLYNCGEMRIYPSDGRWYAENCFIKQGFSTRNDAIAYARSRGYRARREEDKPKRKPERMTQAPQEKPVRKRKKCKEFVVPDEMTFCGEIIQVISPKEVDFDFTFASSRNQVAEYCASATGTTFVIPMVVGDYKGYYRKIVLTDQGEEKVRKYIRAMVDGGYLK